MGRRRALIAFLLTSLAGSCTSEDPPQAGTKDDGGREAAPAALGCIPGESRQCAGPNGCVGYQACVDDGTGFQPCRCGSDAATASGGTGSVGSGTGGSGGAADAAAGASGTAADSGGGGGAGDAPSAGGGSPVDGGGATSGPDATGSAAKGHAVLIGHLYDTYDVHDELILGNAIFLSERPGTVDILEYVEFLSSGGLSWDLRPTIHPIMASQAAAKGRSYAITELADYRQLDEMLPSADVLLVYHQMLAQQAQMNFIAYTWQPEINAFLDEGGVVVVLDYFQPNTSPVQDTSVFLNGPGLFSVPSRTPLSGEPLEVAAPSDAVAGGLTATFAGSGRSTGYPQSTGGTAVVRRTTDFVPMVRHLVR